MDNPTYPPVKPFVPTPTVPTEAVAKSIAKPSAFSKPGTIAGQKATRFRALATKRAPTRKRKRDPRQVTYY